MTSEKKAASGGRLQDRVAIITGAARGMGEATAELYVAEGAQVVICDVNREQGEATAARIGANALFRHLDIRDEQGWKTLVDDVVARFGRIDVLVNNAATCILAPLEQTDITAAREMIDTNIFGALIGAKTVAAPMRAAGKGVIINVSSLTGMVGMNGLAAYSASKWAVRGLTRSIAFELGPFGIRVVTLVPGGVNTVMNNPGGMTGQALNAGYVHVPLQRIGETIEIARASLFLASDEASYVSATELVVDGGDAGGYYQPGLPNAPEGFFLGRR